MLSNFKLKYFVNLDKIEKYFNIINNKYQKEFPNFLEFFKKAYLTNKPFKDKCWNFNKLENAEINIEKKFFTNNFVESCNLTLKLHYVGGIKAFLHFESPINDLI